MFARMHSCSCEKETGRMRKSYSSHSHGECYAHLNQFVVGSVFFVLCQGEHAIVDVGRRELETI